MPLTPKHVHDALRTVQDPDLHKDLVTLNMVKDVAVEGDRVSVTIELTTPACPMKDKIQADIEEAIEQAAQVHGQRPTTEVNFTADVRPPNKQVQDKQSPLPNIKHIVAVGSGKGGVGKSTVSVNLAVGLARAGAAVGLLDGDIYGPSLPTMMGLTDMPPVAHGNRLEPFRAHGVAAMTIGKLVEPEKALVWRGPMAHGAFKQLLMQTEWGNLDYLIIDLPPGTGDVPLTLAQLAPLTGAVVVCTPQQVAQDDARRAIRMFQQLGVDILGVVENMSYFIGDDSKEYDIFGRDGARCMAEAMNVRFLGQIPIHMELRRNSDAGTPLLNFQGNEALRDELDGLCGNLASQISIRAASGQLVQPTLSIQ